MTSHKIRMFTVILLTIFLASNASLADSSTAILVEGLVSAPPGQQIVEGVIEYSAPGSDEISSIILRTEGLPVNEHPLFTFTGQYGEEIVENVLFTKISHKYLSSLEPFTVSFKGALLLGKPIEYLMKTMKVNIGSLYHLDVALKDAYQDTHRFYTDWPHFTLEAEDISGQTNQTIKFNVYYKRGYEKDWVALEYGGVTVPTNTNIMYCKVILNLGAQTPVYYEWDKFSTLGLLGMIPPQIMAIDNEVGLLSETPSQSTSSLQVIPVTHDRIIKEEIGIFRCGDFFSDLNTSLNPVEKFYYSEANNADVVTETIAEVSGLNEIIEYGHDYILSYENTHGHRVPFGITEDKAKEIDRILGARLYLTVSGLDYEGQAQLYGNDQIIEELAAPIGESVNDYIINIPPQMLSYNYGNSRFVLKSNWQNLFVWLYPESYTLHAAKLELSYIRYSTDTVNVSGGWRLTHYPESQDRSNGWTIQNISGATTTNLSKSFIPTVLSNDPDITSIKYGRLNFVCRNLGHQTAKVWIKGTLTDWIDCGFLSPTILDNNANRVQSINHYINPDILELLIPGEQWTLKIQSDSQSFTYYSCSFTLDYYTDGHTPPELVTKNGSKIYPIENSTVDYVNSDILLEFTKPMDLTTFEDVQIKMDHRGYLTGYDYTLLGSPDKKQIALICDHFRGGASVSVIIPDSIKDIWGQNLLDEDARTYVFHVKDYGRNMSAQNIDHTRVYEQWTPSGWTTNESHNTSLIIGQSEYRPQDPNYWEDYTDSVTFDIVWPVDIDYVAVNDYWYEWIYNCSISAYPHFSAPGAVGATLSGGSVVLSKNFSPLDGPEPIPDLSLLSNPGMVSFTGTANGNSDGYLSFSSLYIQSHYGLLDPDIPTVTSSMPLIGASGVTLNSNIELTFDKSMIPGSLSSERIIVSGGKSGQHEFSYEYNSSNKTVTINPFYNFASGESVNVQFLADSVLSDHGTAANAGTIVSFSTEDITPPMPPSGFNVNLSSNQATLSWTAPTLDADGYSEDGLAGYNIYRMKPPQTNYIKMNNSGLITNPSYTDSGLENLNDYWYKITAVDTTGNESTKSLAIAVTPVSSGGYTHILGGDYVSDQSWPASGSPYIIDGDIRFLNGAKLLIEKGTQVRFAGNYKLEVDGILEAEGLDSEKIVFTSNLADSGRGSWKGIIIKNAWGDEKGILKHFEIHYAARGLDLQNSSMPVSDGLVDWYTDCAIRLNNSHSIVENLDLRENEVFRWTTTGMVIDGGGSPSIDNCQFAWNIYGINISGSDPVISNVSIVKTNNSAIYATGDSDLSLISSVITDNYSYGIYMNCGGQNIQSRFRDNKIYNNVNKNFKVSCTHDSKINAKNNYWGTDDYKQVPQIIEVSTDDVRYDPVLYTEAVDENLIQLATDGVNLQGTLTELYLYKNQSPYYLTGDVVVQGWFIIQEGVEVIVLGDYAITAEDVFDARGTEAEPIKFYYTGTLRSSGSWKGIKLEDSCYYLDCYIDYVQISDAATALTIHNLPISTSNMVISNSQTGLYQTGQDIVGSAVQITNSQFHNCDSYAINLYRSNATIDSCTLWNDGPKQMTGTGIYSHPGNIYTRYTPVIMNNEINGFNRGIHLYGGLDADILSNVVHDNGSEGIYCERATWCCPSNYPAPNPLIQNNQFYGNGNYALYFASYSSVNDTPVINALNNWWGTTDPTEVAALIYENSDNSGSPIVNFCPYWTDAGGSGSTTAVYGGSYSGGLNLSAAGGPYQVPADIYCPDGLVIEAGTELQIDAGRKIVVDSTVDISGTELDPVIFTSSSATPSAGDWSGIEINNTINNDDCVLDNVIVRYATIGVKVDSTSDDYYITPQVLTNFTVENCNTGFYLTGNDQRGDGATIQNAQLHNCDSYAINLYRSNATIDSCTLWNDGPKQMTGTGIYSHPGNIYTRYTPVIMNNEINGFNRGIHLYGGLDADILSNVVHDNGSEGIYCERATWCCPSNYPAPNPLIQNNQFYGNGNYALYFASYSSVNDTPVINALNNWWGTTDPTEVAALIYENSDNSGSPIVNFCPYWTDAGGSGSTTAVYGGSYSGGLNLSAAGGPYQVPADIYCPDGLVIEAGTELQIDAGRKIVVDSTVDISGTELDPVIFTSSSATPSAGDWSGIEINNTINNDDCVLDNVIVRYATIGVKVDSTSDDYYITPQVLTNFTVENCNTGFYLTGNDQRGDGATIQNAQLHNCDSYAINLYRSNATIDSCTLWNDGPKQMTGTGIYSHPGNIYTRYTPVIMNNEINGFNRGIHLYGGLDADILSNVVHDNGSEGIYCERATWCCPSNYPAPNPLIQNNQFYGNGNYALYFASYSSVNDTPVINALNNWWGTTDPTEVAALIYENSDNSGSPIVNFCPYWTDAGGSGSTTAVYGGSYSGGLNLSAAGGPYQVPADIYCPDGLVIEAGTELQIDAGRKIVVDSTVDISGTELDPVIFTSSSATPSAGDWSGIEINNTINNDDCVLDNVIVRYATIGVKVDSTSDDYYITPQVLTNFTVENCNTGFYLTGNDQRGDGATIQNAQLHNCDSYAINLYRSNATIDSCTLWNDGPKQMTGTGIYSHPGNIYTRYTPVIMNNEINGFNRGIHLYGGLDADILSNVVHDNGSEGIYCERATWCCPSNYPAPNPLIQNNQFYGNGNYALYFASYSSVNDTPVINALNNWWGTTDPTMIEDLVYDDHDESSRPVVNYTEFLPNPDNAVLVSTTSMVIEHAYLENEYYIRLQYPESMDANTLPTVTYDPWGVTEAQSTEGGQWSTSVLPNDTFMVYNTNTIDYTTGNGRATIRVEGAIPETGEPNFVHAEAFFFIEIPSDSGGPTINNFDYPTYWREDQLFEITANITDQSSGDHGIPYAFLIGGYEEPYDLVQIIGDGPGGDGDGTWSFTVPAQLGQGEQDFRFRITAADGVGRINNSGQMGTRIISYATDADTDGLLDWWEYQYFNSLGQVRDGDADGDRVSNILEYYLGTNPNSQSDTKLMTYFNFDSDNVEDYTPNDNDATLIGCSFATDSVLGSKSIQFTNPGDSINLGFEPLYKSSIFTISMYIKVDEIPVTGEYILWDNLDVDAGMRLFINDNGEIGFYSRSATDEVEILTNTPIIEDTWYYLAVTSDGDNLIIYLNAEVYGQGNIIGKYDPADMTMRTYIGNDEIGDSSTQFRGLIDEISYWDTTLSQQQQSYIGHIYREDFSQLPDWRTGYMDGIYSSSDANNFEWDQVTEEMALVLPNSTADPDGKYCYSYTERKGSSFFLRFDTTIENPGYEAPLRMGLKQTQSSNWTSGQEVSCEFTFRTTGFTLKPYIRDGNNQVHSTPPEKEEEWKDGFRLDDPAKWVTVSFIYDVNTRIMKFILTERSTGTTLASHDFTNVNPFSSNLDKFVISTRFGETPDDAYTTYARFDNIEVLPFSTQGGNISRTIYVSTTGDDLIADGSIGNPFGTIQAAIDSSWHGDTVLVLAGNYTGEGNRDIDTKGISVTLKSQQGPDYTTIDCQASDTEQYRAFHIHNNERAGTVIKGFTIENGYRGDYGGAIYCQNASPTIRECALLNSYAQYGGAVYCDNEAMPMGINILVAGNRAVYGGALALAGNSNIKIVNGTIIENKGDYGGGIWASGTTETDCRNSILWSNTATTGQQVALYSNASISLDYCDIEDGTSGIQGFDDSTYTWGFNNIESDPNFTTSGQWNGNNWTMGDYHLNYSSPCLNRGDNREVTTYLQDLEGNQRIISGTVDIGAYEIAGVLGDLSDNGRVNLEDFSVVAANWMRIDCSTDNGWCDGSDFDTSGDVGLEDLLVIANNWLNTEIVVIYDEKMNDDPLWETQGQWEFGSPMGLGGDSYGYSDPDRGFTGINVYGVNLNGDYDPLSAGTFTLKAGPFNCSQYRNISLKFARWLNTDDPTYVQSWVEVSNDGTGWTTVWEHEGRDTLMDEYWKMLEYDISSVADGESTIYLRWVYQVDDYAYPFSGWNIDDVQLWGMQN